MRHRKAGIKLNRTTSHRNAMFRNMVTSLFKYERIRTTGAKAKELRKWADHLITLAKRGDLHARRQALSIIREKTVVYKLFKEAGEKYGKTSGGYTRIVKIGNRPGDAAPVSLIELITAEKPKKKKVKKAKGAVKKKKAEVGEAAASEKEEKSPKTKKRAVAKKEAGKTKDEKSEKKSKKPTVKKALAEKKESETEKKKKQETEKKAKTDKKEEKPVKEKKVTKIRNMMGESPE